MAHDEQGLLRAVPLMRAITLARARVLRHERYRMLVFPELSSRTGDFGSVPGAPVESICTNAESGHAFFAGLLPIDGLRGAGSAQKRDRAMRVSAWRSLSQ